MLLVFERNNQNRDLRSLHSTPTIIIYSTPTIIILGHSIISSARMARRRGPKLNVRHS